MPNITDGKKLRTGKGSKLKEIPNSTRQIKKSQKTEATPELYISETNENISVSENQLLRGTKRAKRIEAGIRNLRRRF